MDKQTESLLKKAITKKIILQNKQRETELIRFLQNKKLLLNFGTAVTPTIPGESGPVVNHLKTGRLLGRMAFCEFDKGDVEQENNEDAIIFKAKLLNGADASFYSRTNEDYETLGEMCTSTILGQLFGIAYPNPKPDEPLPFYNIRNCSYLHKIIPLAAPYTEDVFVRSITSFKLPQNKEEAYYAATGNSQMMFCGIDADADTFLSYHSSPNVYSQSVRFIRALRAAGIDDTDEYINSFTIENQFILPAGVNEFVFIGHITNNVYSSFDFSNLQNLRGDEYGFALVDLRNKQSGSRYPIMRDPLGAWEKQPFGGASICTTLEFYTIVNDQGI